MERTQFDRGLAELLSRPSERLLNIEWRDAKAIELKGIGLALFEQGHDILDRAVERALNDKQEWYLASENRRNAEKVLEDQYEAMYNLLNSRYYAKCANDPPGAEAFATRFDQASASKSSSEFRGLSMSLSADVFQSLLDFSAGELEADVVSIGQDTLTTFNEARRIEDQEEGEHIQAMSLLEDARDQARVLYLAGRKVIDAALTLEGIDPVNRYLPTLDAIYRRSSTPPVAEPDEPEVPTTDGPETPS